MGSEVEAGKASRKKCRLKQNLKDEWVLTRCMCLVVEVGWERERCRQAEGTANAKVLRQVGQSIGGPERRPACRECRN